MSAPVLMVTLVAFCRGQDQPPTVPTPPPAAPTAPIAPAPPPVLENSGKPMALPFQCTLEDIQGAGLSCSEEDPCPIYLELTAVESKGSRIFAAGNIHTNAVTLSSALLASEDDGRTWREVHEHIRGSGLETIQFLDSETGWVSGQILFPLPQDPFLLLTSDGGKTWRQRPVFGDSRENRFGSILQFSFTAKDSGNLIVDRGQGSDGDRYESYGSPDAGESWSIKETSNKPLRLRQPPVPSADWRLRADGPTQSYHIEHRQGARWTGVAAFAVKLGACKPPQPAEETATPAVKKQ